MMGGRGIRWLTDASGYARIEPPPHFPLQPVSLLTVEGEELDRAVMSEQAAGGGTSYTFSRHSREYPRYAILRIGHTDYLVVIP